MLIPHPLCHNIFRAKTKWYLQQRLLASVEQTADEKPGTEWSYLMQNKLFSHCSLRMIQIKLPLQFLEIKSADRNNSIKELINRGIAINPNEFNIQKRFICEFAKYARKWKYAQYDLSLLIRIHSTDMVSLLVKRTVVFLLLRTTSEQSAFKSCHTLWWVKGTTSRPVSSLSVNCRVSSTFPA